MADMYALDRLTAEDQTWDYAIIHAKGIQPMVLEWKDRCRIRRIRDQGLVEINKKNQDDPFNPARGPQMGPDGMMPAHPGYLVDVTEYYYEDEIVRITFFHNKRINTQAEEAFAAAQKLENQEQGSLILTSTGEDATQELAKQELAKITRKAKHKYKEA